MIGIVLLQHWSSLRSISAAKWLLKLVCLLMFSAGYPVPSVFSVQMYDTQLSAFDNILEDVGLRGTSWLDRYSEKHTCA